MKFCVKLKTEYGVSNIANKYHNIHKSQAQHIGQTDFKEIVYIFLFQFLRLGLPRRDIYLHSMTF